MYECLSPVRSTHGGQERESDSLALEFTGKVLWLETKPRLYTRTASSHNRKATSPALRCCLQSCSHHHTSSCFPRAAGSHHLVLVFFSFIPASAAILRVRKQREARLFSSGKDSRRILLGWRSAWHFRSSRGLLNQCQLNLGTPAGPWGKQASKDGAKLASRCCPWTESLCYPRRTHGVFPRIQPLAQSDKSSNHLFPMSSFAFGAVMEDVPFSDRHPLLCSLLQSDWLRVLSALSSALAFVVFWVPGSMPIS